MHSVNLLGSLFFLLRSGHLGCFEGQLQSLGQCLFFCKFFRPAVLLHFETVEALQAARAEGITSEIPRKEMDDFRRTRYYYMKDK